MIRLKHALLAASLILMLSTAWQTRLWAAEKDKDPAQSWSDSAELSYVQTGGNTNVTTFSAKNDLKYPFSDRWTGQWKAGVLYGETDNVKTAERYTTDLRLDYIFSRRIYGYGQAGWLQDKFAGLDSRYYAGPGLGYRFLDGPRHFLSSELGADYAREDYIDGTDNDFMEGRAFGKYEFKFNDNVQFSQEIEYLNNFKDQQKYKLNATTALTSKLNARFGVKASYEIRYDNAPTPETLKNTDTVLSMALVVNL